VFDDDYDDDDVCFELIPWIRLVTFNGLPFGLTIYTSFPHLFPLSHLLPCVVSLSFILIFFLPIFHSLPFLDFVCALMIWRFGILWCMGMVMFYFDVCGIMSLMIVYEGQVYMLQGCSLTLPGPHDTRVCVYLLQSSFVCPCSLFMCVCVCVCKLMTCFLYFWLFF
jgi:hypothetical protein